MIGTGCVIFWIICEVLNMSFLQKIFKRNSKQDVNNLSTKATQKQSDAADTSADKTTPGNRRRRRESRNSGIRLQGRNSVTEDTSDSGSDKTSDDYEEHYIENRKRKLKSQIYKLRKQREKLRRRQTDALALEQEIRQVLTLISVAKQQNAALKEDVLNKKCELKFLKSEVPEGYEMEAKKKEPLFYKKYNTVKSASDARALLENVQQKIKALQYIELLTYNKYLDYKHDLKSNFVIHRSAKLSKNKKRHFGPVKEALKYHARKENSANAEEDDKGDFEPDAIPLHTFATVTIESSLQEELHADITSSTPPAPAPAALLPAHLFRGPLSLASSATMATETFI